MADVNFILYTAGVNDEATSTRTRFLRFTSQYCSQINISCAININDILNAIYKWQHTVRCSIHIKNIEVLEPF